MTTVSANPPQETAHRMRQVGVSFLHSRYAPLLTHVSLAALTALLFGIVLSIPPVLALICGAPVHHRIWILLHEYVHGIPFRKYRFNVLLLTALDGLLMSFGAWEIFRGIHLAHHRWLNTPKDPVYDGVGSTKPKGPLKRLKDVKFFFESLEGKQPYVKASMIYSGFAQSLVWVFVWRAVGQSHLPMVFGALNLYTFMVTSALRGTLEHRSHHGNPHFANDYRVWIPAFNINRHIHHHLDPRRPWYLLTFMAAAPIPAIRKWHHWYHEFVKRDYVTLQPMSDRTVKY